MNNLFKKYIVYNHKLLCNIYVYFCLAQIYMPLLAPYSLDNIVLTTVIFYVFLILLIASTGYCVSLKAVTSWVEKYGDYILPVGLIATGVYIIWNADCISIVCSSC